MEMKEVEQKLQEMMFNELRQFLLADKAIDLAEFSKTIEKRVMKIVTTESLVPSGRGGGQLSGS